MNSQLSTPYDQPCPRLLVLGLGNDLLRDDSIGLRLAQALKERLPERSQTTILESSESGLALLDLVCGFDEVMIVDAVQTGHAEPGYVHDLDIEQVPLLPGGSPHFLGIAEMLALGRELLLPVPARVRVFAIEVEDPYTIEQSLTPALSAALPGLIARLETLVLSKR